MFARLLLWRLLGVAALIAGVAAVAWLAHGGIGNALREGTTAHAVLSRTAPHPSIWASAAAPAELLAALGPLGAAGLLGIRWRARRGRRYVRLCIEPYRGDRTSVEGIVAMFEALHKRLQCRWWRRLLIGQPSVSLETHHIRDASQPAQAVFAVTCPVGMEPMVEAALRSAYPNCRLAPFAQPRLHSSALLRLVKHTTFIKRVKQLDRYELAREPPIDRLLTAMGACGESTLVQLALTPTPASWERYAKWRYKHHEHRLSRERREHLFVRDRSLVEEVELRGGLEVQHRPLFFADLRVVAPSRRACEQIASELCAEGAENRLVRRGAGLRRGMPARYHERVARGEGNPWPSARRGVYASPELAALWQLPSIDYATVPLARGALPLAPAPPAIMRPRGEDGVLRDALGQVSIHPHMRRQNTAVQGTVEQGKSSYLAASVAEDVRRERCAVIVLDPKGDAAEAAVGAVPAGRTCTLLDFAHPTCGFNPLAVDAPADTIADYVVGALRQLFTDADIRASSDRYLRNAIIAVLAHDRRASLWDAARLLSVGEEGYAYRARVGAHVRTLPEYKEIAQFFTAELSAQLADSRSTTTAKLDAPVNKLARLLNSPSIKRVLLNESLTIDLDRVIARAEVLVVRGALGAMGAGNTAVLMQLLTGMLDAALARQQDSVPAAQRIAVALKVDEAPLVVGRNFAETLALKRSAGLETVACWQTDAQWTDRELRAQLDALFAHRVYFATASAADAREAAKVLMAEYSDTVRPGITGLTALGRPDARLHLPKHHAIVSWVTPEGRQAPFIASTIPLRVDHERLALHAARQAARGGRYLEDLRQPHWERRAQPTAPAGEGEHGGARERPEREGQRRESLGIVRVSTRGDAAGGGGASMPHPHGEINNWPPLPATAAESYAELAALDAAHRLRWASPVAAPTALEPDPDPLDLEVLAVVASLRHVLTSQLHRRLHPHRALTTTQRRLKRLSDAGLVERFQFHRRDGGGAPMCYTIAAAGVALLRAHDRLDRSITGEDPREERRPSSFSSSPTPPHRLPRHAAVDSRPRRARRDLHVAGWVLALERALGAGRLRIRGSERSAISPPLRATPEGPRAIGPAELRLPGGRVAHDFLCTLAGGARVPAERFETVRPDASVELPGAGVCLLVERDDRLVGGSHAAVAKLERYEHLLAGWAVCVGRFSRRDGLRPFAVFLCRNRHRARECARRADQLLCACRAYAGERPAEWEYPGRTGIVFAAERDAHEGVLLAYGVPPLPPAVRTAGSSPACVSSGSPGARAAMVESRLLPGAGGGEP